MLSQEMMTHCILCPRDCGANRLDGQKGYCQVDGNLRLGRAALHFWEEPCISGVRGSGAVFFSGCNMGCVFCQNHRLAIADVGEVITTERLVEIYLELQEQGAHNINLVTPTHYVPQIVEALRLSKAKGLSVPIVYNSSGYEKVETLKSLEGLVDIYLPDFKYAQEELARKYSKAIHYFEYASLALQEMVRQVGTPVFDEEGMMQKGVIVRHLMLPGQLKNAKQVVKYLYETYGNQIYVSLMNQYTPLPQVSRYKELNRKVTKRGYENLVNYALALGLEQGFIQEGETAKESFIPAFNGEGVTKQKED